MDEIKSSRTKWIYRILFSYFILVLLIYASSYAVDLSGMEFSFLYQVQFIEKYGNLYLNPDQYPFFIFYYPPLYTYFMHHFLITNMHVNIFTDVHKALFLGRFISFSLLFFIGLLLFRTSKLFTKVTPDKILLLLLLLIVLPRHFYTFRPDSLKLAFFTLFLYYILKYHFIAYKKIYLAAALTFAVTAVFFKHDVALYILVYFVVHYFIFKQKESIYSAILFSIATAMGFFICYLIFGGFFLKNLFPYNIQYSSELTVNLVIILKNILKTLPFILICYFNLSSAKGSIRFTGWVGIIFSIVSNLSILRVGANLNYTYESLVLLIINFAIWQYDGQRIKYQRYPILLIGYLLLFNQYLLNTRNLMEDARKKRKEDYEQNMVTSVKLKNTIGKDVVFFPNGKYIVYNASLNIMYGYDLHLERFTELYLQHGIKSTIYANRSTASYDQSFSNGFVKYIIIENDTASKKQMKKYYKNYYFYDQIDDLLLYKTN